MDSKKKIKVTRNGPYQVTGDIPLDRLQVISDDEGASTSYGLVQKYPMKEEYFLCRCGKSKLKTVL